MNDLSHDKATTETTAASKRTAVVMDANTAAAHVAFRVNDVCAIYPITPSTPMAELADQWTAEGKTNIWGESPQVVEMQSEAGAAGAVHGSLQGGALTTTFTASQGLLLMVPNMYKIAGELSPAVFHVAARSLAAQGLSIFGDHQDVMSIRPTGWALMCSHSVQAAHDLALVAQAATLEARIPFVHFFDGFRTSHELNKIELLEDADIRAMIDDEYVLAHRKRALNPDHPFIRGTAQNPDVYFQGRETVNRFYQRVPEVVEKAMAALAERTGRVYKPFEYHGPEDPERLIIAMGSGTETVGETVDYLAAQGEKVGMIRVTLFRPFSGAHLMAAIPESVKKVAVLDRTKEPGASGEPMYNDVVTAFAEADRPAKIVGGRYGLSSKEFTPAMVKAVFDELDQDTPRNHFTVGIIDDLTNSHLDYDRSWRIERDDVVRAVFHGLGSDGTVGANKNSIKIIGDDPDRFAQGYFVYDSKKSGSRTTSHLRFGPRPIRAPWLIDAANFIGCHVYNFVHQFDVLATAQDGATFLLNAPFGPEEIWDELPERVQRTIVDKNLEFYVIDAARTAREAGMGNRTNTIMQTAFFALSGVMPRDEAIEAIKEAIRKTYGRKGEDVVAKNCAAVDAGLEKLHKVAVPDRLGQRAMKPPVPDEAPSFVKEITARMMIGEGDQLPVSAIPEDGTWPTGTTRWEKRAIADFVPEWDEDLCIQCGNCAFVCPHAAIRSKLFDVKALEQAPDHFPVAKIDARGFPDTRYALQIYSDDCTGCSLCVEVCPAKAPEETGRKALNLVERAPREDEFRANERFFESLPWNDRSFVEFGTVRGTQFLQPLFEFSGACAGCGETPYVKAVSQLFGDRLIVANATGCSSIYGGNLPTTPWAQNAEGRGPAWSNSLFEDNAEFGLGMRLAADGQLAAAKRQLAAIRHRIDADLVDEALTATQRTESQIRRQRERVARLREQILALNDASLHGLLSVLDQLVRRSVWIMGGDGWAYDIGSAGVDHVLASGRDVNILVMDTEVYSNTGGQASKSTPIGAVAKFAFGGKQVPKKDLALQAVAYGNVYVARVAMGANPQQTLLALREAEAYPGPSIVLAYSHCIAHGINVQKGLDQQFKAVHCGHWPLLRYNPEVKASGENPFVLDSQRPSLPFREYAEAELRYRMLRSTNPAEADALMTLADKNIRDKYRLYEEMAALAGTDPGGAA